ncbi:MAG: Tc toxin subunit A, partial [Allosphingosinicella sp.]
MPKDRLRSWQRLLRLVSDPELLAHLGSPDCIPADEEEETRARRDPKRAQAEADVALVESLERRGLLSACQVAAMPESRFVANFADDGVAPERLREVHGRALRRRNGIHNLVETVRGRIASPYARALRSDNLPAATEDYFTDFPSYQEMFGGLNYCACAHCQSVLGPAAYFLDVMGVIDTYITGPNTIPPGYSLRERRPDLFTRKLTCANTEELVPFLRISEDVVATRVEAITGSTSVYRDVAIAVFPSNLPYNLPLAELREYFTAAGTSLAAGYAAFLVPAPATSTVTAAELAAETLGLSPDQAALLVTPDATQPSLAARYGLRDVAALPDLQRVAVFTDRTGLSYAELADLLTQQLSTAEVAAGAAESFF